MSIEDWGLDEVSLPFAIRRCAEIEDELESRGLNQLQAELKDIRDYVKNEMLQKGQERAFDESSGYTAELQVRQTDVWDADVLISVLPQRKMERYVSFQPNVDAIKEGLKNGDLQRPALEAAGAVRKVPKSAALYIKRSRAAIYVPGDIDMKKHKEENW